MIIYAALAPRSPPEGGSEAAGAPGPLLAGLWAASKPSDRPDRGPAVTSFQVFREGCAVPQWGVPPAGIIPKLFPYWGGRGPLRAPARLQSTLGGHGAAQTPTLCRTVSLPWRGCWGGGRVPTRPFPGGWGALEGSGVGLMDSLLRLSWEGACICAVCRDPRHGPKIAP